VNVYVVAASDAEGDAARRLRWGDYWFKEGLSRAIVAIGHTVVSNVSEADVLINCHGMGVQMLPVHTYNVLWVIGHPARLSEGELMQYDAVYSESEEYAAHVRSLGVACEHLPGATDFVPMGKGDVPQSVFVGNWREGRTLPEAHYPLHVWGEGWQGHLPDGATWEGVYLPHEELNALYGDSAEVLNETHADMVRWGTHNPRYYDVLAARGEAVPTFADCAATIMARVPEQRVMLDLGCGKRVRRGFVGIDTAGGGDVIRANLETGLAFDDPVDVIVADNLLEHLHRIIPLLNDCHEALLPRGRMHITVPNVLASPEAAFSDPTHVRYFTPATWDYFDIGNARWREYGTQYGILPWRVVYVRERDGRFLDVMMRPAVQP